jgi:very-short-patch-repair endonuclease
MAAVLACGRGAALSHRSAAELWGLLRPVVGPADVSISTESGRRRRRGIRVHRRRSLAGTSVTEHRGIPVTTPARTIADLRKWVPPAQHRRAIRQAEVLGLRTGIERSEPTRSELEHLFLRLCESHRLPAPEVNVRVGPFEVDFLWRAERLIVETDGYRYHRGSQAFEDDRARDLTLRDAGLDVLHFAFRQVANEPERVAALVLKELRRARAAGPSPPHLPAVRDR